MLTTPGRSGRSGSPRGDRRRAGTAMVAAGALAALAACSGGDAGGDEEVTLTFAWWGDASRAERYEKSIDLYEEQNPGVTIQTSYAGFGDYWTARNTEAASGSLPDVMQMDVSYLSQYGATGQIAPLDEFTESGAIDISSFPESVMPAAKVDGKIFGIPTSTTGFTSFVNTGLVEELGVEMPEDGVTWDEYDAFLTDVGKAGAEHDPVVGGTVAYTQVWSVFEVWLRQQGKALYTPEGELGFTEADLTAWWERAEPLFADGGFADQGRVEQLEGEDLLGIGEAGSEISYLNFLVRYSEGSAQGDFAMVLPPTDDPGNSGLYLKPSLELSMSANTEHPDEAAKLIDFLANDPEVSREFGLSRGGPISQEAADALEPNELDQKMLDYLDRLAAVVGDTPPPPPEGAGALEVEFTRIAQDIAFGETPVDDAVQEFFGLAPGVLG
ncbi:ABC transporter substrate-binding protein [Isoptericola sp. 4D.3]|uniref:ABC transporter substrate-binding protein n=1 Tax=Isoptericola peretonis TaxID=2918523 RepID=A0ABT0J1W3_9MICO|nr:ABC transporter substrate-binding protein [Isoptericola sp. 4D.3]